MGYAGGTSAHPTYRRIGDHTETVEVDFDPRTITYGQLLEIFLAGHGTSRPSFSRQYRSAVFVHDKEQERTAREALKRQERKTGKTVYTAVEPYSGFTLAEDYHQKYLLRSNPLFAREFQALYPDPAEFTRSTAAARVNGYLGGNGSPSQLEDEAALLGMGAKATRQLADYVRENSRDM